MYVDYDDANDILTDILRSSNIQDRPHVEVISMSSAYDLAKETVSEPYHRFVFMPSTKTNQWLKQAKTQCKMSKEIVSPKPTHYYKGNNKLQTIKYLKSMIFKQTPCVMGYEIQGLTVHRDSSPISPILSLFKNKKKNIVKKKNKRIKTLKKEKEINNNEEIKPIFMSYEDLMTKWNEKRKLDPSLPLKPPVSAMNLLEVVAAMEHSDTEPQTKESELKNNFKSIAIVPSLSNVKKVDSFRRSGGGKARKLSAT
mmetsp:Transcript_30827/g.39715  ORF Transcript_30827/g.39715 Transcript_30827/m.39715 type:complete len:254 (+) Transcript_30827:172-933(+)